MLAGHGGLFAIGRSQLHPVAGQQGAGGVCCGDLVGLEQLGDAAGELFDDFVLAGNHFGYVDARVVKGNAVHVVMLHLPEMLGGIQYRLGGNAAHIEAGATQRWFAVLADKIIHAQGFEAQLGRTDGGHVATGAAADNDHVELFAHGFSPYRFSSRRAGSSSAFLTSTRNSTASLPSMMRWS